MRIVFTGGGTGGHITPLIAVTRELKRLAEEERILDLELFYCGPNGWAENLLQEEGIQMVPVTTGKIRRYFSLANVVDIFRIGYGIMQGLWNMFLIMPDVVFSKGGYGALPVVVAAALFRVPLIIHESDAVPGRVNRFSARFATRVGIAFEGTSEFFPAHKTARVGVPIRKRILGGNKEDARRELEIWSDRPVVSFFGASQGAQKLNDVVLEVLRELTDEFEVLHQTGARHTEAVAEEARVILEFTHKERYHPFGFLNEGELRFFFAASDLIVSRASATSIFEIAAWGKPAILIPLSNAAQDHQQKNAYEYARTGAAGVIEETNLTPHILLAEIKKLMSDPERMKKMFIAAQQFSRIDAAELIAKEILKLGIH